MLYSLLSGSAHGEAPAWHMRAGGDVMHLKFIRDPRDSQLLINFVVLWTVRNGQSVLTEYRSEELVNFSRRYAEHWRPAIDGLNQATWAGTP